MAKARVPLQRMLDMAGHSVGQGDVGRPGLTGAEGPKISGD